MKIIFCGIAALIILAMILSIKINNDRVPEKVFTILSNVILIGCALLFSISNLVSMKSTLTNTILITIVPTTLSFVFMLIFSIIFCKTENKSLSRFLLVSILVTHSLCNYMQDSLMDNHTEVYLANEYNINEIIENEYSDKDITFVSSSKYGDNALVVINGIYENEIYIYNSISKFPLVFTTQYKHNDAFDKYKNS